MSMGAWVVLCMVMEETQGYGHRQQQAIRRAVVGVHAYVPMRF